MQWAKPESQWAQWVADWPSSQSNCGKTWPKQFLGVEEEYSTYLESVAWNDRATRPRGHFGTPSATKLICFPYKYPQPSSVKGIS
jgi:hypothetical protein